jgi:DNA-directed RNA polymerase specialized sigma24 family protein
MALPTLKDFLKQNAYRTTTATVPASQRLTMILTGAGGQGMTYSELARMLDLDSKTLRSLLNAMVTSREITVSYSRNGIPTYKMRW